MENYVKNKNFIISRRNDSENYGKKYMKKRFNSDDDLLLQKSLKWRNEIKLIILRTRLIRYKCWSMMGMMSQRTQMLIKLMGCIGILFVITDNLLRKFQISKSCKDCHNMKQQSMSFNGFAIVIVGKIMFIEQNSQFMIKNEAINTTKNANLSKKGRATKIFLFYFSDGKKCPK